ncbi:hypothetical protein N1851_024141 [Merluccius polli]|uniref:Uncharacterized protein n=1 Tax=Merluccius polli TaxID=89951 RepID=A0AA47MFB3_MERPO|nr:hypothetical protein N1851_024141 [Merluccius polli]
MRPLVFLKQPFQEQPLLSLFKHDFTALESGPITGRFSKMMNLHLLMKHKSLVHQTFNPFQREDKQRSERVSSILKDTPVKNALEEDQQSSKSPRPKKRQEKKQRQGRNQIASPGKQRPH